MPNFSQDKYIPRNAGKYMGTKVPFYRSSWELRIMRHLDMHPYVIKWASEPVRIPYYNPIKREHTVYVPDFFMIWMQGTTQRKCLFEIKPLKQKMIEYAKTQVARDLLLLNYAKWIAATKYAEANGMYFRVFSEDQLFHQGKVK